MNDKWFKEDLKLIFDQHSIAVLVDESGDAEFLLKCVRIYIQFIGQVRN